MKSNSSKNKHSTIRVDINTKKRLNDIWKDFCNYGDDHNDLLNRLIDYYLDHKRKKS